MKTRLLLIILFFFSLVKNIYADEIFRVVNTYNKFGKKGKKIKKRWIKDPAIYSSPKGPDSLCGVLKLPNKSLP